MTEPSPDEASARAAANPAGRPARAGDARAGGEGGLAPLPSRILWTADMEEGDLSDWEVDSQHYDGCWKSGQASCSVSSAIWMGGRYSAALTIRNDGRRASGARLARTQAGPRPPLPIDAYYSAWFYVPRTVRAPGWWLIMGWKHHGKRPGSDPTYSVNIHNRRNGAMYLRLFDHSGRNGRYRSAGSRWVSRAPITIPVARWFRLACRYRWGAHGIIACWQDGIPLWNLQDVRTKYEYDAPTDGRPFQFMVTNYSDNTVPREPTIFVDDATIGLE